MVSPAARILLCLCAWATAVSAFNFTNSFDGWVGNTTYTVTWISSTSDPAYYNLVLARPHDINTTGVAMSESWLMDWSMNVAVQIPSFGDQFYKFALPVDCQPGYYYWFIQSDKIIPVSSTFFIGSSPVVTSATPSSTQGAVTISSFVPVTATESVIGTSEGQLVTFKPSDVFSSAIVYTTIIVIEKGESSIPRGKIHMIVGVSLAALFLITMPIVLWLLLRYRRRPSKLSKNLDKGSSLSDTETHPNSSALDLLALDSVQPTLNVSHSTAPMQETRQVWTIVDGEKRQIPIPRYATPPPPPASTRNPFADPVALPRGQTLPHVTIPHNANPNNSTSSLSTPVHTLPSHANTVTSRATPNTMHLRNELSAETQTDTANAEEKASRSRRPRQIQETQPLLPEEVAARIFVPGRAIDMGPLGRTRFGDVDENGLLPPDYSQATQPVRTTQPGPGGP